MKVIQLICFLFLSLPASAQKLSGVVLDDRGNAIEYANVIALDVDSLFISGTITNASGAFEMKKSNQITFLKITCLGYNTTYINLNDKGDRNLNRITLQRSSIALSEVTVKADRTVFRQKGGSLFTQVQGTALSKMNSIQDLLMQIPGVVEGKSGGIEIFNEGSPVILLNNRQIRSKEELEKIEPSDIKHIELITTPGAKYGADVSAVINILTINKMDGFSLLTKGGFTQNERTSFSQSARLGYKYNQLSLSGSYDYEYNHNKSTLPSVKELALGEDRHRYEYNQWSNGTNPKLTYQLSADYTINNNNAVGILWDGNSYNDKEHRYGNLNYFLNYIPKQSTNVNNNYRNDVAYHHFNAFYSKNSDKSSLNINTDYVYNHNNYIQNTMESNVDASDISTHSVGGARQNMFASKIDYFLSLPYDFRLSLGGEVSYTDAKGNLLISSMDLANSSYTTSEKRYAVYSELSKKVKRISVTGGLRFEDYKYKYNDHADYNSTQRHYRNLFPSIQLSYEGNRWNHTLVFSSQINRPSFQQLSNSSYYSNEYMYQQGNPLLVPVKIYNLKVYSSYKYFILSAGYSFLDNYISTYFANDGHSNIIVSTYKNYNSIQHLTFSLSIQKKLGSWSPSLSLGVDQPFFKYEYRGEEMHHNRISLYCVFNQNFMLPHDFILSSYFYFNTGGNQGAVELKPFHSADITLQKSLLHDKLTIGVQGKDLFHGMKFREKELLQSINFNQTENYHLWNYSFFVTFRLNSKKTTYRGKNSLDTDIKRL